MSTKITLDERDSLSVVRNAKKLQPGKVYHLPVRAYVLGNGQVKLYPAGRLAKRFGLSVEVKQSR